MSNELTALKNSFGVQHGWARSLFHHEAGWTMEARWVGTADEPWSQGPIEILIKPSLDSTEEVRQRGVTTGVMRRMERQLGGLADRVHERPSGSTYEFMARGYVKSKLDEIPEGPRQDAEAFYSGLLELHEDIRRKGYPKPIKLLAAVAGVPEGTIKTRLAVAKRRAASKFE